MSYTDEWTCDRIKYIAEMSRCMGDGYVIDDGVTLSILNKSVALIDVSDNVEGLQKRLFRKMERLYYIESRVKEFMDNSDTTIILNGGHNVKYMINTFNLNRITIANGDHYCPTRFDLRCFDMRNIRGMAGTFENCNRGQEILFGTDKIDTLGQMDETFIWCTALEKIDLQCIHTDKVTPILRGVFASCYSLEEINMPNVTNVTISADCVDSIFKECGSLKVVNCPNKRINKLFRKHVEHLKELEFNKEYYDSITGNYSWRLK